MTDKNKMLNFVLQHYAAGKFDADEAFRRFCGKSLWRRKLRRWSKIALSAAAAAAFGVFLFARWQNTWMEYKAQDRVQTFSLPDRTSVTLSPGAALRLQPHKNARAVEMSGRVRFDVAHDEAHPFEVRAGEALVRVLGTVFQVSAAAEATEVHVFSGKVLFASGERGLLLTADRSARLTPEMAGPEEVRPLPNPAAWMTGKFVYDGTPVETVLQELSAFYGVTLTADAAEKRLTGEFSTADRQLILSLIETALDIKIDEK